MFANGQGGNARRLKETLEEDDLKAREAVIQSAKGRSLDNMLDFAGRSKG